MNEKYVPGFIHHDKQVEIILKAQKIGYDVAFFEYGAGTYIVWSKK